MVGFGIETMRTHVCIHFLVLDHGPTHVQIHKRPAQMLDHKKSNRVSLSTHKVHEYKQYQETRARYKIQVEHIKRGE